MSSLLKDCSVSALVAGLIATVISYAGPLVMVFQAAHSAGLGADGLSSWVLGISIGSGVLGIVLSLYYRVPVIIAWSAPGSALLVALLPTVSFNEAIGVFGSQYAYSDCGVVRFVRPYRQSVTGRYLRRHAGRYPI